MELVLLGGRGGRLRLERDPRNRHSPLCRDRWRVGVDAPSNIARSKKSMVDSV